MRRRPTSAAVLASAISPRRASSSVRERGSDRSRRDGIEARGKPSVAEEDGRGHRRSRGHRRKGDVPAVDQQQAAEEECLDVCSHWKTSLARITPAARKPTSTIAVRLS